MKIFSDWCDKYIGMGLNVTPLNGKRPFLAEWQLANHDYDDLTDKYPACNIGLICGELSGVIAIDVDLTDEDLINRVLNILPPCEIRKRGAKGLTLFYRYQGEINQKLFYNGGTAIELLSTGNQTVLPPSIHPDTKLPYKWDHLSLLDIHPHDLPLLDYDRTWPRLMHLFGDKKSSKVRATFNDIKSEFDRSPHGSFLRMQNVASRLIKARTPIDKAVNELLTKDKELHTHINFFNDPRFADKGTEYTRALKFYSSMLDTFITRQKQLGLDIEQPIAPDEQDDLMTKLKVPSITPDCMPKAIWDYVENQSRINETAIDYVFISTALAICTPLGDRIKFKPKKNSSFSWRPKMSVILVGDPSVRKSRALTVGLKVFKNSLAILQQMNKTEIEMIQKNIKSLKGQLKKVQKDFEKSPDDTELLKEMFTLDEAIKRKSQNPLLKSWIINNATIQSIMDSFENNEGAYLQEWDEISGWLEFIEQKTQAGARAEYLSLINQGLTDYKISRKDHSLSKEIKYAHVNLIGTTQPTILKAFMTKEDGLIQRFQIIYPDFTKPFNMVDEVEDFALLKPLSHKIFQLLQEPLTNFFEVDQNGLGVLTFNDEAYDIYYRFDRHLRELGEGAPSYMKSFYDKSMSFFFNLCAIYYFIEHSPQDERKVQKHQAIMAVKTVLVYFEHIKRIYNPDDYINPEKESLESAIMKVILEHFPSGEFNASMIKKKKPSLDTNAIDLALNEMALQDKVKPTFKKRGGSKFLLFTL